MFWENNYMKKSKKLNITIKVYRLRLHVSYLTSWFYIKNPLKFIPQEQKQNQRDFKFDWKVNLIVFHSLLICSLRVTNDAWVWMTVEVSVLNMWIFLMFTSGTWIFSVITYNFLTASILILRTVFFLNPMYIANIFIG